MGEVIRSGSAADEVIADVLTTLTRARAKGGAWTVGAEEKLGAVEHLADVVFTRLNDAEAEYEPLAAALDVEDEGADHLLGSVSDDIWNRVGRPASAPVLSLMFPGGIAFYTDGSDAEQPDRMDLLAEFLDAGMHTRLDAKVSKAHAKTIRDAAQGYRKKVEAQQKPAARVKLLQAMKAAVGRYAQTELVHLKRRYKSENFSEAEIHAVIPCRARGAAAKPAATPLAPPADKPTP